MLAFWNRPRGRTPTILQMEAVECGAACLAMVLAHHGRWEPLERLRIACGVSRDGVNARDILRAARSYGLTATGFKAPVEQLAKLPVPLVVFWEFNHFVVVEDLNDHQARINDPARGRATLSLADFARSYAGVALTFERGPNFTAGGESPRPVGALLERLVGVKSAFAYVVGASLLLVLSGLIMPGLSKIFVDSVVVRGLADWLRPLVAAGLATILFTLAVRWLQQTHLLRLTLVLASTGLRRQSDHLLRLPVSFFDQRQSGDVAQRMSALLRIADFLSGPMAANTAGAIGVVVFGAALFAFEPRLAAIVVGAAAINVAIVALTWRSRQDTQYLLALAGAKLAGRTVAGLGAIESVKVCGLEHDFLAQWAGDQARYVETVQTAAAQSILTDAAPTLIGALSGALVLGLGAMFVMNGDLSLGDLVAFQGLTVAFSTPLGGLIALADRWRGAVADLARIDDVMRHPVDRPADEGSAASPCAAMTGRLEFDRVTFGFSPIAPPQIVDLSLTVTPGRRVALVGLTGSGKSTALKLAAGLYRPQSGHVTLDGIPLEQVPPADFAAAVAFVDQDIHLLSGTVRDNLAPLGGIADRDLATAARDAAIHDTIMTLPDGYDALVEENGRNFSGGERQRLDIARALAGNPALLLLDEATSALDPETERHIDDALRRRGLAVLMVAHRLSTVRDCDEIIVLVNGRAVQRGDHESLMRAAGPYAAFVAAQ